MESLITAIDPKEFPRIILAAITQPNGGYAQRELSRSVIQSADNNRFLVIRVGWVQGENRYAVIQDIEIKDGVVFIHQDNQEEPLKEELIEAGIPASAIIEAFMAPEKRPRKPLND